jgi:hypothetical protein
MRRKLEAEMSNIKASVGIGISVRKDSPFLMRILNFNHGIKRVN